MTVFKGFMTITKRNLNILFLYIAIFLAICFAIQKMDVQNTAKSYSTCLLYTSPPNFPV